MEGAETALKQKVKSINFDPSVPAYCHVRGEIITQDSRLASKLSIFSLYIALVSSACDLQCTTKHPVKVLKIVRIMSPIPFQLHEPSKPSSHHDLVEPPLFSAMLGQNPITTYSCSFTVETHAVLWMDESAG